MEIYDVVTKFIGPIEPVGETREDDRRWGNLKQMTLLVDKLMGDISRVVPYQKRVEFSMKRAGGYAHEFINDIKNAD